MSIGRGARSRPTSGNIVAASRGSPARIDLNGLKLSASDLTAAVLLFPGHQSLVPRPARVEGAGLLARIPEEARDGFIVLQFRRSGPHRAKREAAIPRAKGQLCPSGGAPAPSRNDPEAEAILAAFLTLQCPACTITCPTGALRANPRGECHVDPALCIANTYFTDVWSTETTPDGRTVFRRYDESACLGCFAMNETVSARCNLRRMRKVAYNSGACCANCDSGAQVLGVDLPHSCPEGAITLGDHGFVVDPERCTGCMICFRSINCINNSEDANNTTLKMVAHGDNGRAGLYFTVREFRLLDCDPASIPQRASLVVRTDLDQSILALGVAPDGRVKIAPHSNATGVGRLVSLALVRSGRATPPALVKPAGPLGPWPVTSVSVPATCHSGTINLPANTAQILYSVHE